MEEGNMDRKAILVIDMLNDFVDPQGALYCGERARAIIPAVRQWVDAFSERGDAVIYLQDAHLPDDREFDLFPPHAVKGTWGSRIIPEMEPPAGAVTIEKMRYSGFYGTRLEEVLARFGPGEVWVTGVCTSICVMDTVGGLRNRDYPVVVPRGGVADFDPEFHDFSLRRMERIYGATLA
jgi:nicotinamidase-related amidase